VTKIEGSGSESGSISQRHGSADPDPPQNVMDPQHWFMVCITALHRTVQLWSTGEAATIKFLFSQDTIHQGCYPWYVKCIVQ
jgi:hypothetical protein